MWLSDYVFPITVGERVEALYNGAWLPGVVTDVVRQDSGVEVTVDYDEYDPEPGLGRERIRRRSVITDALSVIMGFTIGYPPGTRVICNRYNRGAFQPGWVAKVHRNGLYDIEYDEGQVEENVGPQRLRLHLGEIDLVAGVRGIYEVAFTTKGRLAALGIDMEPVAENHTVPTRFQKGDKILIDGRKGVWTVTGFAGSSDATVTLIGLARDRAEDLDDEDRRSVSDGGDRHALTGGTDGERTKKKRKKSLLQSDDNKPCQLYYPQASWRLTKVEQLDEGAAVVCFRDGDDDKPRQPAVIVDKVAKFTTRSASTEGRSLWNRCFGGCFGSSYFADFDPQRSTYVVRYADGFEERLKAKDVVAADAVGQPLEEGAVRFKIGDLVTFATEGADHWLEIEGIKERQVIYNITFDDGDKEYNLTTKYVRKKEKRFRMDDEVTVNYRGSGKLVDGRIIWVNEPDDFGVVTYDVRYGQGDFGEEEEEIDVGRIFSRDQPAQLRRGAHVYARRRSNQQWYSGRVSKVDFAPSYKCRYLYTHTDPETGQRIAAGTVVDVLEDDIDSPLSPLRYTLEEGRLYRLINAAMFGRHPNESLDQPPRLLTSAQKDELRSICEAHAEDIWNALDPQIYDIERSFLHTVRDAQTDKRRANYIEVSSIVFEVTEQVPIDAFDENGLTPLYLACVYADEEIAYHLIEHGADPLMPCIGLKTPAHLIMDPNFSIENSLLTAALMGIEGVPGRRQFSSIGGRKRRVVYNFALLNSSFYDVEPNATPNCFLNDGDFQDKRRHVGQGVSPLRMMVQEGLTDMITVPVVHKLLDEMWARFTFAYQLWDAVQAYLTIVLFLLISTRLFGTATPEVGAYETWVWYDWTILVMMAVIILLVLIGTRDELYELRRLGMVKYFSNAWNIVEVVSYLLLCFTLALDAALLFGQLPETYHTCSPDGDICIVTDVRQIKRRATAASALLVWVRGLKYVTMFQAVGVLVRMVGKMMFEFAIFLVIFFFFICGWANAFTVLMSDRNDANERFSSFIASLITCFRLSLGDFEFDDFVEYEEELWLTILLWFSFLCVGCVLMLNLLIAQLSNVYSEITQNVSAEYLLSKADVIFNTQDQLCTSKPDGVAGRGRIEHLNLNMTFVPPEEVEYNRIEAKRLSQDEQENYSDHIKEKLRDIEIEVRRQSAIIEAGASRSARHKGKLAEAKLRGTDVDDGDDDVLPSMSMPTTTPLASVTHLLTRGTSPRRPR